MTTPVQPLASDALPLMSAADPAIGQNNQRDIAKYLLQGLLVSPGASGFIRRGVVHRGNQVAGVPQELMVQELGPSGNVQVVPGYFWVHRGSISGVDEGARFGGFHGTTPFQVNLPAANGSQTRYDGVFAKIIDKNLVADAAETPHGPSIDVRSGALGGSLNLAGTPGAAGAPPTTPDGYLPLAFIARAVSDNTVSQAEITDVRRGTCIPGTPRVLFPWDIANISSDTGYAIGELRQRLAGSGGGIYPAFIDRWDGTVFRGTRGHKFTEPAQTTANTLAAGAGTTLATGGVVIPWPGFPYRFRLIAQIEWSVSFSSGNSRALNLQARIDTDAYVDTTGSGTAASPRTYVGPPANVQGVPGGIVGFQRDVQPSGGIHQAKLVVDDSPTITDGSSHTVYVRLFNDDDTSTATLIRGIPYRFTLELIPA